MAVMTEITEKTPIVIPIMVSADRSLLAPNEDNAMTMISRNRISDYLLIGLAFFSIHTGERSQDRVVKRTRLAQIPKPNRSTPKQPCLQGRGQARNASGTKETLWLR